MKYNIIIFFLSIAASNLSAQSLLTLQTAVNNAINNNLELKSEQFNTEIDRNSITRANAGQMPTISLSANLEYGLAPFTQLELGIQGPTGENTIQEFDFTNSTTGLLAANANYTLYDGKQGKYRYEQLQMQYGISQTQVKMMTERIIQQTVNAYIAVARQQSLLELNTQSIELSQERIERLEAQAKYGTAIRLQLTQAVVDLKSDSATYRTTALNLERAKNDLSVLMGQIADEDFRVEENFQLTPDLEYARLKADLLESNNAIVLNDRLLQLNELNLNLTKTAYQPRVQAYAEGNYLRTTDEANILLSNELMGFNFGLRASYNLFDGGLRKTREQNAKLAIEQQRSSRAQTTLNLETQLNSAFLQYEDSQEQLRIEESNLVLFEENYERVADNYKLGQASATDLRSAQLNLNAANNRINNLRYNIKQAETALLYLSGRLVE
ncbi:MAG: TolC family protein [Bacteroidota bacterium]